MKNSTGNAASAWVSPLGEELHGLDVEPLSGCDVLIVRQLHRSLHSASQALVQTQGARRPHQLQAGADHVAHNCRVNTQKQDDFVSRQTANLPTTVAWLQSLSCLKYMHVSLLVVKHTMLMFSLFKRKRERQCIRCIQECIQTKGKES